MTTVATPSGTPAPVYNRSGITIDTITAAATRTAITRYSGHTVVLVSNGGSTSNGVELPSGAEIGDVVEVLVATYGQSCLLSAAAGDSLNLGSPMFCGAAVVVRKTTSTGWSVLSAT